MNGRKRTVQIKFRVTEAERDLILEKMKLVPTRNMAAYLRKIAIDGYIIQIDHADIKAMTAEIQKIGVNVNQIARRVNATGNAYQEDIEEIKGVLAEIWRLQRLRLKIETVKDSDEKEWIGVFTSSEEMHKGSAGNVQMNQSIESILRLALNWEQVNGIVINPFGKYIQMTKKMIELLINGYEYNENERKSKDDENN